MGEFTERSVVILLWSVMVYMFIVLLILIVIILVATLLDLPVEGYVYIMMSLTVICIISFAIVIGLLISNYLCLNRISNNHNDIIRRLCTAEKFIAKVKSDITTIISRNSKDNVTTNSNFNRLYNSIKGTNERIDNIHAEILILKNKAEISFNNSKSNNTTNKNRKFDNKPKKAKNGNITTK